MDLGDEEPGRGGEHAPGFTEAQCAPEGYMPTNATLTIKMGPFQLRPCPFLLVPPCSGPCPHGALPRRLAAVAGPLAAVGSPSGIGGGCPQPFSPLGFQATESYSPLPALNPARPPTWSPEPSNTCGHRSEGTWVCCSSPI